MRFSLGHENRVTFSPAASPPRADDRKTAWQHIVLRVGTALALSPSLPDLLATRDLAASSATAAFTVCDDSPGPLTIALIQIWQDKGQWKSSTTTTTQNHATSCDPHTVSAPLAARSAPQLWIAVQVTDVDGRQGSLRTAPAP